MAWEILRLAVKRRRGEQNDTSKGILTQLLQEEGVPEGTGLHVSNRGKTICRIFKTFVVF